MRDYFLKLFAHEHWANQRLLAALKALPQLPPRALELLAHLLVAQVFWDKRLRGEAIPAFNFQPKWSLDDCAALIEEYDAKWRQYLEGAPPLLEAQTISYTGLDGKPYTYRVADILTHLHAHSMHHRAQITTVMRAAGLEPVPDDYIRFCRETEGTR